MISKGIKTGLLQTAKAGLTPQPRRKAGRCGPLGGNCPERVGAISGLIAIGMLFVSTRGQVGAIENNQNPQWKSDAESTLLEIPLNGEWEYYPLGEDKPYEELPEGWEKTYVPVDQSKYNAFAKSPYVWFRRSFEIPEEWKGKKISLRFGGINSQADFWCNGELVDTHIVGWAPYRIDITRQMKIGESNLVSVKVARYAQIEGEKIDVYGYGESYGIYGGVKLEAHPLVYIDNLYIRTLVKESKIEIDVWIRNEDKKDQEVNLAAEIIDKTRIYPLVKNLASEEIKVGENSLKKFTLSSTWDNPHYWSLNDPYLYHLLVKIDSPEGIDQREVRFGFREFLAENGNFYLNGRKIRLRGDTFYVKPGWDNPAAIRGLLRFLKSHGSNSFRIWAMRGFSTLFKVADEEGILLDAVAAAGNPYAKGIRQDGWTKWEWDSESKFADVFDDVASRFIRCYWNHPSIVMWNLNNEYVIVKHGKRFDERMKALRRFIELHKKLDPYRPLTTDGDDAANDEPEMAVENIHDYSDVYDFWPITKFQRIDEKMVFDGKRERHYAGKKPLAFGEFHGRLPYFPAVL